MDPYVEALPLPLERTGLLVDLRGTTYYKCKPVRPGGWHSEGWTLSSSNLPGVATEFLTDFEGCERRARFPVRDDAGPEYSAPPPGCQA